MRAYKVALFAAFALTGCNGVMTPAPTGSAAGLHPSTSVAAHPVTAHPDRRPSWISDEAKAKEARLLFVSDAGTDDVYMYKLPALTLVGTITGFAQPQGECADSKGNVWITDTNAQAVYEVSHQGRLENTLSDSSGYPVGCAWNPKTGKIAVMNLFGIDGAQGGVLVYQSGSSWLRYANPSQYYYDFGGYDSAGNLFFDGRTQRGGFVLSKLAAGAKSATSIKVSGAKIVFPGMVQWDASNSELLVGDQECGNTNAACVYSLKIGGSGATVAQKTKLANASGGKVCDLVQGVEANGEILGSDYEFCGYAANTTDSWAYPAGGKPSDENGSTDMVPVGAAISTGKSGTSESRRHSWMRRDTSGDDLVYVSDADGEVTVYDYATMNLVGVLAKFQTPTGECTDKSGDVYIVDATNEVIYEYVHGGTTAIKALNDAPYAPNACSIDPTTGNLAVANSAGTQSTGTIAIYTHAVGKPTLYTDTSISTFAACAYDNAGDLLVAGTVGSSNDSSFAWIPKRIHKLAKIAVPGPSPSWSWYYVSGIQWDGKFLALDRGDGVYQIALFNGQAYYVGETSLDERYVSGAAYGIYDPNPKQQGTRILVGYKDESYGSGVYYFPYPGGGSSNGSFSHGVDNPRAIAISLAK
ncbi:MAG: hypothetical protein WB609_01225 [Candidatus Cybelea sp.]